MSFKIQSFKFSIVGTVTAGVYYVVLYAMVEYISFSIVVSSSIAYVSAIILNYMMHYQWTFSSDCPHNISILRFIIMNIIGFVINISIMAYGSSIIPEYYLLTQAFAMAVIVIWNFIISLLWVYKKPITYF